MSNEFEQPVEPMSRTEDLLRTGTEEPVIAMSRIEKILRGEKIKPQSRIEDLLLKYNPSDILIEKSITENGTYYARIDNADGYYKVVVDTPVIPPTVLEHLVETITTNGTHTYTPGTGVDGYSDATITVDVQPNTMEKSISANGTYIAADDNVDGYSKTIVNVPPEPITETRSVENLPQPIASFNNGAEAPITSLKVAIEPQQDLHGYDSPWVGGAGKNKLAMNISDIKSLNTTGTWNGNTYTINAAEYKINIDTAGNITSINARSVNSSPNGDLKIATTLPANLYILSSGFTETNGINDTFIQKDGVTIARGNNSSPGPNFEIAESSEAVLHIRLSRNDSSFICTPMIRLASVADATFAPYSNICPISGWAEEVITRTGKNLFDATNLINDRTVDASGEVAGYGGRVATLNYISVVPNINVVLTYKKNISQSIVFICALYKDDTMVSRTIGNGIGTAINTGECNQIRFAFYVANGTNISKDNLSEIQLEIGSNATSYEPYNGQTYTIDLGETRYGGEVDVVSGDGTDRLGYVDMGDLNWQTSGNGIFNAVVTNLKPNTSAENVPNIMCDIYNPQTPIAVYNKTADGIITLGTSGYWGDNKVAVYDSRYSDAPTFKTAMSGHQLVYELATPTTYETQTTPINSLKGDNNLMANTGNINDLDYIYVNDEVGTLINKSITANGSYCAVTDDNADGYLNIDVNVESSVIEKTITENGTYSAEDDGYVGYSEVVVNVPPVGTVIPTIKLKSTTTITTEVV